MSNLRKALRESLKEAEENLRDKFVRIAKEEGMTSNVGSLVKNISRGAPGSTMSDEQVRDTVKRHMAQQPGG